MTVRRASPPQADQAPPSRRDYYTHVANPPPMRCPPIKPGTKCCSPVEGPCTADAVGWIFQPEGTPVPGSHYCLRHGQAIVDQHHHHNRLDFHLVFARGARLIEQAPRCDEVVVLDTGRRCCERERGHKGSHRAGRRLWR